jgi:hypothetical protein
MVAYSGGKETQHPARAVSASHFDCFNPFGKEKKESTDWIGGWVSPESV